jgi:hypothetical protein
LNQDGTGKIEINELRDEHSYMQLWVKNSKEEVFRDTTYFSDFITNIPNVSRLHRKAIFQKFEVKVHIKKKLMIKNFAQHNAKFTKIVSC